MSYKQYGPRPCNIETVLSPAVHTEPILILLSAMSSLAFHFVLLHQMKELKPGYGRELGGSDSCLKQGSSSGLEDNMSSIGLVDKAVLMSFSV